MIPRGPVVERSKETTGLAAFVSFGTIEVPCTRRWRFAAAPLRRAFVRPRYSSVPRRISIAAVK